MTGTATGGASALGPAIAGRRGALDPDGTGARRSLTLKAAVAVHAVSLCATLWQHKLQLPENGPRTFDVSV